MSSRTDTAGHTRAFEYPVTEHWGNAEVFSSASERDIGRVSGDERIDPLCPGQSAWLPRGPDLIGNRVFCLIMLNVIAFPVSVTSYAVKISGSAVCHGEDLLFYTVRLVK